MHKIRTPALQLSYVILSMEKIIYTHNNCAQVSCLATYKIMINLNQ